ncbi:hypothetical protein GQR58_030036 [Nymphon striatum]|nr:hypothetical protein GQR58_030036 [Nymphon striatum]
MVSVSARLLAALGVLALFLAPPAAAQDDYDTAVAEITAQIGTRCYFSEEPANINSLEDLIQQTDGDVAVVIVEDEVSLGADQLAEDIRQGIAGNITVLVIAPSGDLQELGTASDIYTSGELDDALDDAFDQSGSVNRAEAFMGGLGSNDVSGSCNPSLAANAGASVSPSGSNSTSTGDNGGGSNTGWWLLGGAAVAGGGGIWYMSRKNKESDLEDIDEAKDEIRSQLALVSTDIVENESRIQLADSPEAIAHFRNASATYTDVSGKLDKTTNLIELAELNDEIEMARWEMEAAEALMDGDPLPPKPEPDKPASCFFDPTHRGHMEECTVKTAAGDKEVIVCERCGDKLDRGEQPTPRMISVGGQRTKFRITAENAMDPEVEIEQAIQEAKKQDQALRNQAAKVIAHRTTIEQRMEKAADQVGEARETAKQALMRAEQSKAQGDAAGVDKWTNAAQSLAMRLQASENNLDSLKDQYEIAVAQSEQAKSAVEQNAMRVSELAAKRMELLGKLQQAKMQESVNVAVEAMSATMDKDAPSLSRIEEKIQERVSTASANAEIRSATPEGAEAELREAVSLARADDKLAELRAELGLAGDTGSGGGAVGGIDELPA